MACNPIPTFPNPTFHTCNAGTDSPGYTKIPTCTYTSLRKRHSTARARAGGAVLPTRAHADGVQPTTSEKGREAEVSGWLHQHMGQGGAGGGYRERCDKLCKKKKQTNKRKKKTERKKKPTSNPNPKRGTSLISQSCNAIVFCESANQEWITPVKHGYKHSGLSGCLGTRNNFFGRRTRLCLSLLFNK